MPAAKLSTLSSSSRKLEEEEEVVYFRLRVYNYKLSSIYVHTRVCVCLDDEYRKTHINTRDGKLSFVTKTLYMFTLHMSTYLIISFLTYKLKMKYLISVIMIIRYNFLERNVHLNDLNIPEIKND